MTSVKDIILKGKSGPPRLVTDYLSEKRSGKVQEDLKKLIESYDVGTLYEIVPMPNSRFSHGYIKGAAFVCSTQQRAYDIVEGVRDFGAAVSVYHIRSFKTDKNLDNHIASKFNLLKNPAGIFVDTSIPENRFFDGHEPSLGAVGCSVSLEKFYEEETATERWELIIRSYHTPSSMKVVRLLENSRNMTLHELRKSSEYEQAVEHGRHSRNVLAHKVLEFIEADLEDYEHKSMRYVAKLASKDYPAVSPDSECPYNNIVRHESYRHDSSTPVLVFYRYCYGLRQDGIGTIPIGLGRHAGWLLCVSCDKRFRVGSENTFGAFPMGVPKMATVDKKALDAPVKSYIVWGSNHLIHEKVVDPHEIGYFETQEGTKHLNLLGFPKYVTTKPKPRLVYVTSPLEDDLTIHDILRLLPQEGGKVKIPCDHEFIDEFAMKAYMNRKLQDKGFRMKDLLQEETDFYFVMNVADVQAILGENK
jgi:hypothetical protein